MVSVQRIPERFHPILEKVLACTLDRATGDRPALGQIFVITHAKAIAMEIVRDAAQCLTLGPERSCVWPPSGESP